jgi:glutamate carboxypeptidase
MENSGRIRELESWLDERNGEMLDLLGRIVSVNSHTTNKAGVDRVAAIIARAAQDLGLAVETVPGGEYGDHLVARTPACGRGGGQVLFCGHMDTVFTESSGFTEFRIEGGKAFGPGVIDMKGGLVVGLYALRALEELGLADDLPAAFIFNSEEEIGSPSSAGLIRREAEKSLFALVFECGGMNGEVATGRKGKTTYIMDVHGRAGHAGEAGGVKPSAVLELAEKIIALEALNDPERGVSVNVGQVSGGSGPNIVAAEATAMIDTRFRTRTDGETLAKAITGIAEKPVIPGTVCELTNASSRPAMEASPGSRALFEIAGSQAGLLGARLSEEFRGGVSDANLIADAGVPVLDGMGPCGEHDHSPREYMVISSLAERTALTALTVAEALRLFRAGELFGEDT